MNAAYVRCYSLNGLNLSLQFEDKALADESALLSDFLPVDKSERSDTHLHIDVKFASSEKPAPIQRDSVKPYIVNDISIFDTKKAVDITDGYSTFHIEPWSKIGMISIHPSFKKKTLASKYNFFLIGLAYLFSYQGLFDLHGAALDNHEIGYLVLGESNSGKSSIALSLVHQGWHYASDDSLLLKSNGNGVEVLSFRKSFYIDPDTASKYPELDPLFINENDVEGCKRFLDLDQMYPNQFQPSIVPKVIIFSKITPDKKSTLQPVAKGQALSNLLKQSISIFFNRQVVDEHLIVLKRLVLQTDCYQLLAGRDLYYEPGEILKILPRNY
jgi:hypothetical protein